MMRRIIGVIGIGIVLFAAFHFSVQYKSERTHTLSGAPVLFPVLRGDRTMDVVKHLKEASLISSEVEFLYYLLQSKQWGKFVAGQYAFSGEVSSQSIAEKLTTGDVVPRSVRVTFPEGFTAKQMANRLSENNLPGKEFLRLVSSPTKELLGISPLFRDLPPDATLEGFLFPDTYEFLLQAEAEDIVALFLKNFDRRFDESLRKEMTRQQKNVFTVVTLASLLEVEVRSESDRKMVSDLFSRRLEVGMPLQSDATVRYVLGIDKAQYSGSDIATDSPYNTYVYKGLPKGPIDNPGIVSLRAALFPTVNDFWYFLSDQKTGETIFSRDFEEHKRNKSLHGL
ncbi:MAG: endolytic transglycosylase MltG [Candidatus Moranbacteria bacterium]|nr:endolytic transglycosylase MltG [Candidatus Moranbacteria bacterium]